MRSFIIMLFAAILAALPQTLSASEFPRLRATGRIDTVSRVFDPNGLVRNQDGGRVILVGFHEQVSGIFAKITNTDVPDKSVSETSDNFGDRSEKSVGIVRSIGRFLIGAMYTDDSFDKSPGSIPFDMELGLHTWQVFGTYRLYRTESLNIDIGTSYEALSPKRKDANRNNPFAFYPPARLPDLESWKDVAVSASVRYSKKAMHLYGDVELLKSQGPYGFFEGATVLGFALDIEWKLSRNFSLWLPRVDARRFLSSVNYGRKDVALLGGGISIAWPGDMGH